MNGFAALDIHPHRRYVVDIGGRRSCRCRLHINFALFLHSLDSTQNLGVTRDVRRFAHRSSLVAFAGVDPAVNQSGKHIAQSNPATKRGSPHLRKILYQVVCTYLKKSPANEPVYQFLDKKRAEGKPYFVYMTAAQNKFLRIYYARVKECLTAAGCESPEQE